jgi:hypothetical protein
VKLRKKLEPSSVVHHAHDIDALKRAVLEVKDFMQRVPSNMQDVQPEFQVAYKGIVAVKIQKKCEKKEKPTLNVEDIDDY